MKLGVLAEKEQGEKVGRTLKPPADIPWAFMLSAEESEGSFFLPCGWKQDQAIYL